MIENTMNIIAMANNSDSSKIDGMFWIVTSLALFVGVILFFI